MVILKFQLFITLSALHWSVSLVFLLFLSSVVKVKNIYPFFYKQLIIHIL